MKLLVFSIVVAVAVAVVVTVYVRSRPTKSLALDDWKRLWDLRRMALEDVFGPADDSIATGIPPFHLGGPADVLTFRKHSDGMTYVTASLIGDDQSQSNSLGQYELMICVRRDCDWAPSLISNLARYTTEAVLAPNDTMEIGPALPVPTELASLLFLPFTKLKVDGKDASVMLCIGITADEMAFIREHDVEDLISRLKETGNYPFTDLSRKSVMNR